MKHNRVEGKLAVSRYVCMSTIPRESPVSVRPRRLLRIQPPFFGIARSSASYPCNHQRHSFTVVRTPSVGN